MGADHLRPHPGFDLLFCQEARDLKAAQEAAEAKAALRKQAAEADALRFLAEMHCPEDLVAFGERHGIPNLAEMMWLNGFQAGWRACHARAIPAENADG